MAYAAVACAVFFGLLAAWGAVFAPFVRLTSSSFVIACALAASAAAAVALRAALTRSARRPRGRRAGERAGGAAAEDQR